jgi:hypothetical protein
MTDGGLLNKTRNHLASQDGIRFVELLEKSFRYSRSYCVSGLFSLSGVLEIRKHDVSETESVSVLKRG